MTDELRKLAKEAKATDFRYVLVPADMLLAILDRLAAAEAVAEAAEECVAVVQGRVAFVGSAKLLAEALHAWREVGK